MAQLQNGRPPAFRAQNGLFYWPKGLSTSQRGEGGMLGSLYYIWLNVDVIFLKGKHMGWGMSPISETFGRSAEKFGGGGGGRELAHSR